MPTLLEKIEADAAKRLPLPPGRHATKELARYKAFLKLEKNRLRLLHQAGAKGQEVCEGQAAVFDVLLRYLLDAAKDQARPARGVPPPLPSSRSAATAVGN